MARPRKRAQQSVFLQSGPFEPNLAKAWPEIIAATGWQTTDDVMPKVQDLLGRYVLRVRHRHVAHAFATLLGRVDKTGKERDGSPILTAANHARRLRSALAAIEQSDVLAYALCDALAYVQLDPEVAFDIVDRIAAGLDRFIENGRSNIVSPVDLFAELVRDLADLVATQGLPVTGNRAGYDPRDIAASPFQTFLWKLDAELPEDVRHSSTYEAAFREKVADALAARP